MTLQTFVIEIRGPMPELPHQLFALRARLFPGLIDETEENLSDLLPPGFSARIREWDE